VDSHFHGTADELERYALDRLSDPDVGRVEEHLIVCAECRQRFDEIEAYVDGMRDALIKYAAADRDSGWDLLSWLKRPAVSMAFAFLVLVAAMGLFSRRQANLLPLVAMQIPAAGGVTPTAPPTRELDVTIREALPDGGPFRVEVLTPAGQEVWNGLASSGSEGVKVDVQQRLTAGDYFLRVFKVSGEKLKDYPFRIG
jgi:hypothetical protein